MGKTANICFESPSSTALHYLTNLPQPALQPDNYHPYIIIISNILMSTQKCLGKNLLFFSLSFHLPICLAKTATHTAPSLICFHFKIICAKIKSWYVLVCSRVPLSLQQKPSLDSFKSNLKTFIFPKL